MAHPNMDMRELEQKKEMLHKSCSGTGAAKDNLQLMCIKCRLVFANADWSLQKFKLQLMCCIHIASTAYFSVHHIMGTHPDQIDMAL
jgi:hypothetical protein